MSGGFGNRFGLQFGDDSESGGVAYERAASDTATAVDSSSTQTTSAYQRAASDTASAVDTSVASSTYERSAVDTATADDVAQRSQDASRVTADVGTAADAAAAQSTYERLGSETATAVDSGDAEKGILLQTADTATADDTPTVQVFSAITRATSDTVTAVDTLSTALDYHRAAADPASAVDTPFTALDYSRSAAETPSANDSPQAVVTYERFGFDTATAADALSTFVSPVTFRATVDTATGTDTLSAALDYSRASSDLASATDGLTTAVGYGVSHTDTAGAVDTPTVAATYERRSNEVGTLVDAAVGFQAFFYSRFKADTVEAVDWHQVSPTQYEITWADTATALDSEYDPTLILPPADKALAVHPPGQARIFTYRPVIDLNLVRATLTSQARYLMARGIRDGTSLQPYRFELGAGWENPRWGEPPWPGADSTEVLNVVFEGSIYDANMRVEEANASTLVLACYGPVSPAYTPSEVMVYAQIRNSPLAGENFHDVPFACATFPTWFFGATQRFVSRIVVPLGGGL